ncbi:MAG TPA: M28 family peptidase [Burkholderiaceae bacterium]|jgi:Zn-dependent M28 family amino/carboxypeptidase|nr:M28 family peptidase [Burkholderiaceae bacterium]
MPNTSALLRLAVAVAMVSSSPAFAADAPDAQLAAVADAVDARALHATIEKLVGFGTRHTLSDTKSDTRGIGAARRWAQARFEAISKECGGCLEVVTPTQHVIGKRVPDGVDIVDVVAIQRGTSDPGRVVAITGHLDSRVTDVMDATHDAPGADDDGSGTAAVLESARVLSKHRFAATIVYGVLSGEEQGLYGGKVLADYAKAKGWRVEADLNNDIVGNSHGQDGVNDNTVIRVFSEGTKAVETQEQANRRRYNGGELDSPSRNLARFVAGLAERHLVNFRVAMVYRTDRYGRGGDQVPFLEAGFPALRLTEPHEDYRNEHQDLRSENGVRYGDTLDRVDFDYLAQVTRLNAIALAALASAPAPVRGVAIGGAVTTDTVMTWTPQPGVAAYRVWWRDTTAPQWQRSRTYPADVDPGHAVLKNVDLDDFFFGVSAISADGWESPVAFPGDAGSF